MDARKVLIADGSEEFRTALAEALQKTYHVQTCREGSDALAHLQSFRPDILVLDLMIPGLDGISILQAAVESGICPMVLAITSFQTEYITESLNALRVEYLMTRPCDIRATVNRIGDLRRKIQSPGRSQRDITNCICDGLAALRIPPKRRGYGYLREGIRLVMAQPTLSMTKELYPAIGKIFGDDPKNVERAIRTAIDCGWKNRDDRIWQIYFPPGTDGQIPRPSNAAFICRLADCLLRDMQAG